MTRIVVQRGSAGGSSSGSNRSPQVSVPQPSVASRDEEQEKELNKEQLASDNTAHECGTHEGLIEESCPESSVGVGVVTDPNVVSEKDKSSSYEVLDPETSIKELEGLQEQSDCSLSGIAQIVTGAAYPPPPPPPVPPIKPSGSFLGPRRAASGGSNAVKIGSSRRQTNWQVVSTKTSPVESRPSSPKSFAEAEGYNSADEQNPCFVSSYDDVEREHLFELEIKRVKGLEVRRMVQDGNCLFRAVADQVYGDPELYDMVRHMCIDYMEREREHFSQFITEGFTSYCRRKRRDKVYGNNLEIQAFSEMYNRPVHIYSYSTEPINIFHRGYTTDTPPIRLSYHQRNHYNSLVDPRRLTIGAGLGLNSLRGANLNKDQVKAAIQAQQDQQIDNALLAEGRFFSDMELTEKELEQMVIEASRAEFIAGNRCKQQLSSRESSTSAAESSSSGSCPNDSNMEGRSVRGSSDATLSSSVQMVLAMGFSYLQAIEAYSIFGDDVDSMVCYLVEMGGVGGSPGNSRQKGKAAE